MWSLESIERFIKEHPIQTGGAINQYSVSLSDEKDDGDVYHDAEYEFWSNSYVKRSVLGLAYAILCRTDVDVHLRENRVIIRFYVSICDPD